MKNSISKVVVIKVGTSTLAKINKDGRHELDHVSFARISRQVVDLQSKGYFVAIVSSAAITAGMAATGLVTRPKNDESSMPTLQALASIGWRHILNLWAYAFGDTVVGELLVTKNELELTSERNELMAVVESLFMNGCVPILNENDAISHEEIAFGDNDMLAAIFASNLKQSGRFGKDVSLVVLSDVDGVYSDINNSNSIIGEIKNINAYIHLAGGSQSLVGTGGMASKFKAATIAVNAGVNMYIANGRRERVIEDALEGVTGTRFRQQ